MARASAAAGVLLGVVAIALGAWALTARARTGSLGRGAAETPAVRVHDSSESPPPDADVAELRRQDASEASHESHVAVRGRVVDLAGAPIAGASVTLQRPESAKSLLNVQTLRRTTDASGSFAFTGLPPVSAHADPRIEVVAVGFARSAQRVPASGPGSDALTIRLAPAVRVRGRCVDSEGRAVSNVLVRSAVGLSATSGADGRFDVAEIDPVEGILLVSETHVPLVPRLPDGPSIDLGDVVLQAGRVLRGTLVDERGAPVANGAVHARPTVAQTISGWGPRWSRHVRTDASGAFELRGLPFAEVHVEAGTDDGSEAPSRTVGPDEADIRLAIPVGLRVRFRLQSPDGDDVRPQSVRIDLVRSSGIQRTAARSRSSTAGVGPDVLFPVDEAGTFSFTVSVPGFRDVPVDGVVVTAEAETVVPVVLMPTKKLPPRGR